MRPEAGGDKLLLLTPLRLNSSNFSERASYTLYPGTKDVPGSPALSVQAQGFQVLNCFVKKHPFKANANSYGDDKVASLTSVELAAAAAHGEPRFQTQAPGQREEICIEAAPWAKRPPHSSQHQGLPGGPSALRLRCSKLQRKEHC